MQIKIKRLRDDARIPTFAHPGDAGLDLYALENVTIEPGARLVLPLGFALEIPSGYAAFSKDKSGLARDYGLHNLAGVIDAGYRGEYCLTLINLGQAPAAIVAGQKIAQMVILSLPEVELVEVDELNDSARGQGGFGSTGRF